MENVISIEIYSVLSEAKRISAAYPDKSYAMCKEAYDIAVKNNLKAEEGYALFGMALACRAKSEINKMLDLSYLSFEIFEDMQLSNGQIKSLNLIGIAYFYNSMYEEALKYLLKALNLVEELKDDFLLSCVLNNIGEVFRESAKFDNALEYYYRALKISSDNNMKANEASIFCNIGEVYYLEGEYDKALEYFTKSYELIMDGKDMVILGEAENKLGKVHSVNENYSKAEEYFFNALRHLDAVNNKFYAIDVLVNIANLPVHKDSNKPLYYFEKAIQYAEETNSKKKLSEVYKTIADHYEKIDNFKDALEYFKKYYLINQEIMTSSIGNKLEIIKIELDHIKENHKFEKIKMINQRLEMEITNQRNELEKIQKINEILEKSALEDDLTGVPNRRYINYCLNKTWEESLSQSETIALFMIDIDNFKKYNDYWGHSKGDECLIKIANCLNALQTKRNDIFGRYGGEEFIYFAKCINYDQATELGYLIRSKVEELYLNYLVDNKSFMITISVGGVFGQISDFSNIPEMLQIADKELYRAKSMGRNLTLIRSMNG